MWGRRWIAKITIASGAILAIGGTAYAANGQLNGDEVSQTSAHNADNPVPQRAPVPKASEAASVVTEAPAAVPVDAVAVEEVETAPVVKDDPEPDPEPAPGMADAEGPELVVLSPEDGSHHDAEAVAFRGETEPGATVMSGPFEAIVTEEGIWEIVLVLSPGPNTATFEATDSAGNTTTTSIVVHLVTSASDEPAPAPVAFSANQQYGSCSEEVAYDVFFGTGMAGTVVSVSSPFGSGSTEVDDTGNWEIKVLFPDAPKDDAFAVTVSGQDGSKTFTFVAHGE